MVTASHVASVLALVNLETAPAAAAPLAGDAWVEAWVERLTLGLQGAEIDRALAGDRDRLGSWWAVADALSAVLGEIGRRWACGQLTVLQEHIGSERLARGLARLSDAIAVPGGAPQCLLMMVPGDDHTLGLSLVEICLRETGWLSRWTGRRTPVEGAVRFVESAHVQMVAVSASEYSTDGDTLEAVATRLGEVCGGAGVQLLVGGNGRWPDPLPHGVRVRSFEELHRLLVGRGGRTVGPRGEA